MLFAEGLENVFRRHRLLAEAVRPHLDDADLAVRAFMRLVDDLAAESA